MRHKNGLNSDHTVGTSNNFRETNDNELERIDGGYYSTSEMPSRDEMCGTAWLWYGGPIGMLE